MKWKQAIPEKINFRNIDRETVAKHESTGRVKTGRMCGKTNYETNR